MGRRFANLSLSAALRSSNANRYRCGDITCGYGLPLLRALPANATATVLVPAKSADAITESGKPQAKVPGVKFLRMDGDRAVPGVEAGSYRLTTAK